MKWNDTHSKYVILTDFPLQHWLHDYTSMLCCTYYITCLVNIILASMPRSSKWYLSFWFSIESPVSICLPSHVCHMPSQSNPPCFGDPNNIAWRVWIMKFVLIQFPPLSNYFAPLRPTYLLIAVFLNTFCLCSSLNVQDEFSHAKWKVIVLCTFIFMFF